MAQYSIKELEKFSGLKAHTIRIWESRYNVLKPQRTESNIRFYSDSDLKKLMNLALLNQYGKKISHIAHLNEEIIKEEIKKILITQNDASIYIDQLICCMIDLDEPLFNQEFNLAVNKFGFEDTIINIIYPLLHKIGVLWRTGDISPLHEHFLSNLIRNKIIAAIEAINISDNLKNSSIVLYLPEHEMHELGLLFCYYVVKKEGMNVFYLGQRTPQKDVTIVINEVNPKYILSSWVSQFDPEKMNKNLAEINDKFPKLKILVGGPTALHADLDKRIIKVNNISELKKLE